MFYSKNTGGFYDAAIHGENIPTDAVGITPAKHAELIVAQSAGQRIVGDADGYPIAVDPPPPTTAEIWERIKAERDRRTQTGGYPAGGKWFHSDTFSRTQQIGLVMLSAGIPAGTMWKTMDGSFIEMTPSLAQQVFAAAAAQDLATFAAAEAHKAAMEAAADPAAYDFSTGWPAVFAG